MACTQNQGTVISLYKALSNCELETVARLLASDLEWWFHGPSGCQHMMRILTGETSPVLAAFRFEPRNMAEINDGVVIAEGWEGAEVYWVHVWTVKDGMIVQLREYFNTWLTVKDLKPAVPERWNNNESRPTMWQSGPRDLATRSLPGLLLAI